MERPISHPIGTPVEQLDTPALVVDVSAMEHNIETVHSFFRDSPARARPHVPPHKCPAIAHRQIAAGGTVGGISVFGVGEAEVFAHAGFSDILVTSEVVTRSKIKRLCSLARDSKITVAVDNPSNVHDLSEASQANGIILNVLAEINAGLDGSGVEPGQPALDLAKKASHAEGLQFAGLMAHEAVILREDYQVLVSENEKAIQPVLDTRRMLEDAGLDVGTVNVGGTHNYEIVGAMEGVTEVRVDCYPLMDYNYCQYRSQLKPAASVLSTVVSNPTSDTVILDAGLKAIGPDRGLPTVQGIPGASVARLSAEHCRLSLEAEAQGQLDLGAKVWLIPWDLQLCVSQYNYFHVVRHGKLEAVWEIAARGRFD